MKKQCMILAILSFSSVIVLGVSNLNVSAQQAPAAVNVKFRIDAEVRDKKGHVISGLKAADFTLYIDKQPVKLEEFRTVENTVVSSYDLSDASAAPKVSSESVQVLIVVDAVNMNNLQVNQERDQLLKYLRGNGGKLTAPTQLILFKTAGMQVGGAATLDGNAIAAVLEKEGPMMRSERSSQAEYGDLDRYQKSLNSFVQLSQYASRLPGRKYILWLGQGWPLIQSSKLVYNADFQKSTYDTVITMLNQLRQNRVTVYNVRPDADDRQNNIYFEQFLKPVKKKEEVDAANLAVQVLAVESGGRVTDPSNDMAGQIAACMESVGVYYSFTFTPTEAGKTGSYHSIELRPSRGDLKVHTVTGYYEQP